LRNINQESNTNANSERNANQERDMNGYEERDGAGTNREKRVRFQSGQELASSRQEFYFPLLSSFHNNPVFLSLLVPLPVSVPGYLSRALSEILYASFFVIFKCPLTLV